MSLSGIRSRSFCPANRSNSAPIDGPAACAAIVGDDAVNKAVVPNSSICVDVRPHSHLRIFDAYASPLHGGEAIELFAGVLGWRCLVRRFRALQGHSCACSHQIADINLYNRRAVN